MMHPVAGRSGEGEGVDRRRANTLAPVPPGERVGDAAAAPDVGIGDATGDSRAGESRSTRCTRCRARSTELDVIVFAVARTFFAGGAGTSGASSTSISVSMSALSPSGSASMATAPPSRVRTDV